MSERHAELPQLLVEAAEARTEIERLREQNEKLRCELAVWLECYKAEKQRREELIQRVREALGE